MKKSYETPTCQSYEFKVEDVLMQSPITNDDAFDSGGTLGGGDYTHEGGTGILSGD